MEKEFYLLGVWHNAYRANDCEYFWGGPYDSREETLSAGERKQERGQPKTFYDWVRGKNRVFSTQETFVKAANKIGMNPNIDY